MLRTRITFALIRFRSESSVYNHRLYSYLAYNLAAEVGTKQMKVRTVLATYKQTIFS